MPYKKTGIVRVPRSRYIPQMCQLILDGLGSTYDLDVGVAIKSLGNERELLKNFFFQKIFLLTSPKLDANEELKFAFTVVLADFLHMVGYFDVSPIQLEYIIDPVMSADELLTIMLGSRMPTYKASDLGGEWASVSTLMSFFPEVIRRNALILRERPFMAARYKFWLGNIGYKLMTTSSDQLSQSERSFLVIHGNVEPGSKGFIPNLDPTPIPPVENKDPLVVEVGALAQASVLPGPCINHMKLVSNGILEQLIFYYGPHVSDLKTQVGFMQHYGPFFVFDMTPQESIPWLLESQITGVSSQAANITIRPDNQPPFTLRMPLPIFYSNDSGAISLYEDLPEFNLYLTDQRDISNWTWDYYSEWRGRRINSLTDGGTMDYYMCDLAVKSKAAGGMQVEAPELPSGTICWLDTSIQAAKKIVRYEGKIFEEYVLPSANGLVRKQVNMTAFYARFGAIEFLPAFSEFLELPLAWFVQPADRVVDFIASTQGLTIRDRVEFTPIIALCHNCARYTRLTKKEAPIQRDRYILAMIPSTNQTEIPEV